MLAYNNWSNTPNLKNAGIAISAIVLLMLVVNLVLAYGYYQHPMDVAQILWVLVLLEIEYPLPLESFY